jgi:biopolymer transport protein ExbD
MKHSPSPIFKRTLFPLIGHTDIAPYLCVLFLLVFFMVFGNLLILPAGCRIELPTSDSRSLTWDGASFLVVAVDAAEQCYFENQVLPDLATLQARLAARTAPPTGPRRLYLEADRRVRYERLSELSRIARDAGLTEIILGGNPTRRTP